ncbi:MAG: hypothetical protein ACFFG0_00450 [Candidatus Thorarchaeota archaeon]
MGMKEILDAQKTFFKFECGKCGEIKYINVFEILEVGHPLCCDEEMEVDEGVYRDLRNA